MQPPVLGSALLLFALPAIAAAQTDTARVTYRTREIAFINAGRARGLGVGDTVAIIGRDGSVVVLALVVSVTDTRASARLLGDGAVAEQMLVHFQPRPAEVAAMPAGVDSVAAPADSAVEPAAYAVPAGRQARPPPRWHGGLTLEHSGSSNGVGQRTDFTILAADLDARLPGLRVLLRGNTRWRDGSSRSLTSAPAASTLLYQAELRLGPSSESWSLGLGRLMPGRGGALGYLDGARLEVRAGSSHWLGIGGGVVPTPEGLDVSTTTSRAGAWWAFGNGSALQGSLSAAGDFSAGRRRRTSAQVQAWSRLGDRAGVSLYGVVDFPVDSTPVTTTQLTTLMASVSAPLPARFRGSLSLETHTPFVPWNALFQPDTLIPLPGRLSGGSLSLGRTAGGIAVDASAGMLQRQGEPGRTIRGSLSLSGGGVYLMASLQHSALSDYRHFMARYVVPARALPVTLSLGASASMTSTANGSLTFWRYAFRPELSRYLGRGVFASVGGDIGSYAGQSTSWYHAGVSYRFR